MFDRLWAPWRLDYVKGNAALARDLSKLPLLPGADRECFLCRAVADSADRENLVVHRGTYGFTILNRFPYNNGHLLVAPQRHVARLDDLDAATQLELVQTLGMWVGRLERQMCAAGFNVGLNLGAAAGAGVPGHLHWHLVPRWNGDTNFMPVVGGAKVIPQALETLWELLTSEVEVPAP